MLTNLFEDKTTNPRQYNYCRGLFLCLRSTFAGVLTEELYFNTLVFNIITCSPSQVYWIAPRDII